MLWGGPFTSKALLKAGADPRVLSLPRETALSRIPRVSYAKQRIAHKLLRLALDPPPADGRQKPGGI